MRKTTVDDGDPGEDAVTAATGGSVTTSVGWATYPIDAEAPAALLALADAELRRIKRHPRAYPRRSAAHLALASDASSSMRRA